MHCRRHSPGSAGRRGSEAPRSSSSSSPGFGSAGRRGPESTSSLVTAFPLLSTASPSTDCRPLLSWSGRATGRPVARKGGSRVLLRTFRVVARAENGAIAPICDPRISERGVKSTREPPFRAAGRRPRAPRGRRPAGRPPCSPCSPTAPARVRRRGRVSGSSASRRIAAPVTRRLPEAVRAAGGAARSVSLYTPRCGDARAASGAARRLGS